MTKRRPSRLEPGGWAFTVVELLVVLAVIGVLAALLLPVISRGTESGRVAACLSNLRQIGLALQLYVEDNNNRMPIMRDGVVSTNGVPATNSFSTIDRVLTNYLGNYRVLECPSDEEGLFRLTGSSYGWNSLLNNQHADHLTLMARPLGPHQIPLLFDKEAFHRARGEGRGINFLYADGHIKNLLAIEGSK